MKVAEVDVDESTFRPFAIHLVIESYAELVALRRAVSSDDQSALLTRLYDVLEEKERGL